MFFFFLPKNPVGNIDIIPSQSHVKEYLIPTFTVTQDTPGLVYLELMTVSSFTPRIKDCHNLGSFKEQTQR